ncbi:MAG: hypothetical protein FJ294_01365 [Planctomycetes bacterium]|nr:hypothetical protein [Planctomycetota bacterium]
MRTFALCVLLSASLLPGCLAVGAAAGGVVAANRVLDSNVYVTQLNCDSREAWNTTKKFLAENSKELIEWDDAARVAKANIDESIVTVTIETLDLDRCEMTVSAKKYLATLNDGEMAKIITERLVRRMTK